jgi:endoglycosylceramidase
MTAVPVRTPASRRRARAGLSVVIVVFALVCGACGFVGIGPNGPRPRQPLTHAGRWFTDSSGRVVMPRGVNVVEKSAPFYPAATGFGDDDAALLEARGFNTVRLGVVFEALMPQPGVVDTAYIEHLAETVRVLDRHGISVLLDFHQDGWGPLTHGNGMPAWATLTDGVPNPNAEFPLYYVLNPAIQRAFDNFWANQPGPDGVPLQQHYATAMREIAKRFAHAPNILGYEAMNEPWPGANWAPCLTGCPDLEQQLLAPFYARMSEAVASVDRHHPVYVEPFVLFNFGSAATSLPGAGSANALSTHVYAGDDNANLAVMQRSVEAATRDGVPVLATEWGATHEPAIVTTMADQFDSQLLPWLFWAYDEDIILDMTLPPTADNLRGPVLDALTRPYPTAVNGTPTRLAFDGTSRTLEFEYSTTRPGGRPGAFWIPTTVTIPAARYPGGYAVTVTGAKVVSRPCAPSLVLLNLPRADHVTVRVTPAPCR